MNAYKATLANAKSTLIFAHSVYEAKVLVGPVLGSSKYFKLRVTVVKERPWLFQHADVEKLRKDEAHVVVGPVEWKKPVEVQP